MVHLLSAPSTSYGHHMEMGMYSRPSASYSNSNIILATVAGILLFAAGFLCHDVVSAPSTTSLLHTQALNPSTSFRPGMVSGQPKPSRSTQTVVTNSKARAMFQPETFKPTNAYKSAVSLDARNGVAKDAMGDSNDLNGVPSTMARQPIHEEATIFHQFGARYVLGFMAALACAGAYLTIMPRRFAMLAVADDDAYDTPVEPKNSAAADRDQKEAAWNMQVLIGFIGFWCQLALSLVSTTVIVFASMSREVSQDKNMMWVNLCLCAVSTLASWISVAWTLQCRSYGRRLKEEERGSDKFPTRLSVVRVLWNGILVNAHGLFVAIVGLNASVGTLVMKSLAAPSANPMQPGYTTAGLNGFDVFAQLAQVQSLFSLIIGIILGLTALRVVTKPYQKVPVVA